MNIKEMEIEHFKAIENIKLNNIHPIVGIWGPNGCGKSSILHSIVMIRNCIEFGNAGFNQEVGSTDVHNILNKNGIKLNTFNDASYLKKDMDILINHKYDNEKEFKLILRKDYIKSSKMDPLEIKFIRYYPPDRIINNRTINPNVRLTQDFTNTPEQIHSFIHWFIHDKLYEKDSTGDINELDRVNYWAERFGFGKLIDIQEPSGAVSGLFIDNILKENFHLMDGGHGGKSFFLILLEAYSFKNGVLLIEEPEISLHPGAQSEVLDFFIEVAQERGHQIIFTSHSEYLLRKIIRKYKSGSISKDLIQIIACDKEEKGTIIEEKNLDEIAEIFKQNGEIIPHFTTRLKYNYQ